MSTLDDLIRETLDARAHDVDHVQLNAPAPRPGRSRRWVAAGTVVALAAAIVVALVLVAPWRGAPNPTATPAASATIPTTPAGMQWISFHDLTFTVPADWAVGSTACAPTTAPVLVVVGRDGERCAPTPIDHRVVVTITDLGAREPQGNRSTSAGIAMWRSDDDGLELQFPDDDVRIRTMSTDSTVADAFTTGIVRRTVDALGCSARQPVLTDTLGYRAGSIDTADAVSGVVCDYTGGAGLFGSRTLTAADLEQVHEAVRGAVPADPADASGGGGIGLVYRLRLADGTGLVVNVRDGRPAAFFDDRDHWAERGGIMQALPGAYP